MKKKVLITGATSGIGKSISEYFKENGDTVYDVSRSSHTFSYDLSNKEDIYSFMSEFKTKHTSLDILINNAGAIGQDERLMDLNKLFTLLLYTPYVLMNELYTAMTPNEIFPLGCNHVINIASISGISGEVDYPMYAALKAGVINLTKSFAKKWNGEVRVNSISPGFFNTNLFTGDTPSELIDMIPMAREAEPSEIKSVIKMIDESTYMTGANIVIDGGLSL